MNANVANSKKYGKFDIFNVVFFTIIVIIMIYPFWNVLMISIVDYKTFAESGFLVLPKKLDFSAYRFIFSSDEIVRSIGISLFVTIVGTMYNLFLTISYAYALSIRKLPGRKIFLTFAIIPLFFQGGLIPLYLQVKNLGLINNVFAMILPVGINIWYLIIIKNYFMEIPESLREAARIDGANDIHILWQIILPLSKPMIATFLMFYAVERWNEWFNAMLFIQDTHKIPLQKLLRDIVFNNFGSGNMARSYRKATGSYVTGEAVKMATAIVTIVPIAVLFPFFQKYFVKGVMAGAVKQ
ncbi:MAG: carbohydrate ABC transporter permease [Vallitalea sp.]|jgi:putative aldouronate transport system permease protein|nr:carbohydrate ABC transporter permease [Vallitalea sp.]